MRARHPRFHPSAALGAALVLSITCPAAGAAQQPWFLRVEGGQASIHRASSTGVVLGARIGRALDSRQLVRADAGVSYSPADEGYVTIDLGAEVRILPTSRVTPVVAGGAGLLVEPEFAGPVVRGNLALEVRLSAKSILRAGGQLARHGGEDGPNVWHVGLELRL